MLEAVLASIGFLGAGTIVFRRGRDRVSGLTTAASIWTTAGIGLATGAGSYVLAVGATALIFGVLCGLGRIERQYTSRHRPSGREADPAPPAD